MRHQNYEHSNCTINITFSVVSSDFNHNDSNARYRRIAEIVQRDLSRQRKASFLQNDQGTLPTLTQCAEYQSAAGTVNDES